MSESYGPEETTGEAIRLEPDVAASKRVEAVLAAAEEAASAILANARTQGRRQVEDLRERSIAEADKRLRVLASARDKLVEQAAAVSRRQEELIANFDAAIEAIRREAQAPWATAREAGVDQPSGTSGGSTQGARILAIQMHVAGSSREEIERRLSEEFEIDDPSAILDEIVDDREPDSEPAP